MFSQVVSRICHSNASVCIVIDEIILRAINGYPQQSLWGLAVILKSSNPLRNRRGREILGKLSNDSPNRILAKQLLLFVDSLLAISNYPVPESETSLRLSVHFKSISKIFPLPLIIPLQKHFQISNPEGNNFPTINCLVDLIEVLPSLQKPKKIQILCNDGSQHTFLCKPKDDLRKDSRLMEFNTIFNELLSKNYEARKRNLCMLNSHIDHVFIMFNM